MASGPAPCRQSRPCPWAAMAVLAGRLARRWCFGLLRRYVLTRAQGRPWTPCPCGSALPVSASCRSGPRGLAGERGLRRPPIQVPLRGAGWGALCEACWIRTAGGPRRGSGGVTVVLRGGCPLGDSWRGARRATWGRTRGAQATGRPRDAPAAFEERDVPGLCIKRSCFVIVFKTRF